MEVSKEYLLTLKKAYYEGAPLVSDSIYDELERLYKDQENIPVDAGQVYKHDTPYLSLRKIDGDRLKKWVEGVKCVTTPKVDGVSMEIRYEVENGVVRLIEAKTRGGVDRTDAVKRLLDDQYISWAIDGCSERVFVVRGEVYLSTELMKDIQAAGFSNLRNLVAGMVNSDARNPFDKKGKFLVWNWLNPTSSKSYRENIAELKRLKFSVVPVWGYDVSQFTILLNEEASNKFRDDYTYEIDGLVVWKDNVGAWESDRGKSVYQNAVAWKFPSQCSLSIVRSVVWSVGSSGWVTPIAKIDPVEIGGVTVKSVNLFNLENIQRLNLKIGSQVLVERSNDVIPHISQPAIETGLSVILEPPATCPCCDQASLENVGPRIRCTNLECPAKFAGIVGAWAGNHGMKHFRGEAIDFLRPYFESCVDHPIIAMYALTDDKIHALFGTHGKAARFIRYFEAAKQKTSAASLLASLNISGVAYKSASVLLEKAGSLCGVVTYLESSPSLKVFEQSVQSWVSANSDTWSKLIELAKRLDCNVYKAQEAFESRGKVVITGSVPGVSRKELPDYLRGLGWEFSNSVSKDTAYLISQEASNSSKYQAAVGFGVPIVSWDEFASL